MEVITLEYWAPGGERDRARAWRLAWWIWEWEWQEFWFQWDQAWEEVWMLWRREWYRLRADEAAVAMVRAQAAMRRRELLTQWRRQGWQ